MSSKKSQNLDNLITGPLQVTSYYVAAQIPAGEKSGFSHGNAVLRFMGQAFGDHLSVANILKKFQEKAFFPSILG